MKNYYNILEIEQFTATDSEIRQAYKRLMLIHHPDKTDDPQLIQKGLDINQAYKTLTSQPQREEYDTHLKQTNWKLAQATNRHYEVIRSDQTKSEKSNQQEIVSVDCEQCFGNTQITLTKQDAQFDKFINCNHCGLLMKLE